MKKLWVGIGIVVVVILAIVVFIIQTKKEPEEIKIGAILPLTGDLATYGENAKAGIVLLSEEVNTKGGINGKKVEVVFEDSKAQPDQAVTAIQKLINVDKALAIIGDVASSPTLAIAPIANKNKIMVVSPAASSPDITNAGPYIFRVWPSDVYEADRMSDFVKKEGIKTLSLFFVNNDYGRAMVQEFRKNVEGSNITIVNEENFDQNTTDVRTQLTRIKQSNPERVYLISYPKDSVIILRQYKEIGLKSRLLSTSSFEDPIIIRDVGKVAEGTILTSPIPPDDSDPIVSAFRRNYENRFGKKPGLVADYGYDALKVILDAFRISGEISKKGVSKGIQKIKDLKGATGTINFDKNGDVIKPAGIKIVKQGKYVWLEK